MSCSWLHLLMAIGCGHIYVLRSKTRTNEEINQQQHPQKNMFGLQTYAKIFASNKEKMKREQGFIITILNLTLQTQWLET